MIFLPVFLIFCIEILGEALNIGEKSTVARFSDIVRSREFIDKSLFIKNVVEGLDHVVIEAPPGFGKSTNLRMLREFLEMEVDSGGDAIYPAQIIKNYETFVSAAKNRGGLTHATKSYDTSVNDTRNGNAFVSISGNQETLVNGTKSNCSFKNGTKDHGTFGNETRNHDILVNVTRNDSALEPSHSFFVNPLTNYETFASPKLKILREAPKVFSAHFAQYPVLYVDFGTLSVTTFYDFIQSFRQLVIKLFAPFGYLLKSKRLSDTAKDEFVLFRDHSAELNIEEVVRGGVKLSWLLYAHHQRKVIVLVDSFDAPVRKAVLSPGLDGKGFERVFENVLGFVTRLVKKNEFVARSVLTARLRICAVDNLTHYSIFEDDQLLRYFGLTDKDGTELANRFQRGSQIENIRKWYGGYIGSTGHKLFNTFSTVSYLKSGEFKPYLVESENLMGMKDLLAYEKTGRVLEETFDQKTRVSTVRIIAQQGLRELKLTAEGGRTNVDEHLVLQFLLDNGFYTLEDGNQLRVPNFETELDLGRLIFSRNYFKSKLNINDTIIGSYINSIDRLDADKASYTNFSAAVSLLFAKRKPKNSREMLHALLYLAVDSKFQHVIEGDGSADQTRQDMYVKRRDKTGIAVGVTIGPTTDVALRVVFLRCFEVFKECSARIAILIGLSLGQRCEITVSYMYDNRKP